MTKTLMIKNEFHISILIASDLKGNLTEQERLELEAWRAISTDHKQLVEQINDEAHLNEELIYFARANKTLIWDKIQNELSKTDIPPNPTRRLWPQISIAAAVLAVISLCVWFFAARYNVMELDSTARYAKNDISPGKNKATLTLANGEVITLSNKKSRIIIDASKMAYDDGSLLSSLQTSSSSFRGNDPVALTTPRGGTYQVILSDGTKVWLNAASSIEFPSTFTGLKNRSVEIKGEAYFEVYKDQRHPFIVKSANQQVEVLGTHFNIKAYADEAVIKTTLLEGSVQISPLRASPTPLLRGGTTKQSTTDGNTVLNAVILKPGEQGILSNESLKVQQADIQAAVAWKNNEFMFESESIENIMKMVGRWYNVEIVYLGEKPTEKFGGGVSRFDKVSKVLQLLEKTGAVHFKIENRRIYVSKTKQTE